MSAQLVDIPTYLTLYGFQQAPFRLSPDPYFYFPASPHAMAKKIISHALATNEGFMVLSGAAGLGKTLLLRLLIEELDRKKIPAIILSSAVSPLGLLQLLLGELDVSFESVESEAVLFQRFQETILRHAQEGREVLIVVDEAQNMPVATLEQLRMLSNIETRSRKLLQILLIGQEQLEDVLRHNRLAQLVQRIVIHEKLHPLSRNETERYVGFRLKQAGRWDIRLTRSAVRLLQGASRGVPRMINKIMDRTLLLAGDRHPSCIRRKHIRNAVVTMKEQHISLGHRSRMPVVIALGAVALLWLLSILPPSIFSVAPWARLSKSPAEQVQLRRNIPNHVDMDVENIPSIQLRQPATVSKNPLMEHNRYKIHPLVSVDWYVSDNDFMGSQQ